MSLAVRVDPLCLGRCGTVVKGVHFENLRDAGDPVNWRGSTSPSGCRRADLSGRDRLQLAPPDHDRREFSHTAEQVFIPMMAIRRSVRTPGDVDSLLRCGADKVGVNYSHQRPDADRPRRRPVRQSGAGAVGRCPPRTGRTAYAVRVQVTTMGWAKVHTGIDAIWWVKRAEELEALARSCSTPWTGRHP